MTCNQLDVLHESSIPFLHINLSFQNLHITTACNCAKDRSGTPQDDAGGRGVKANSLAGALYYLSLLN